MTLPRRTHRRARGRSLRRRLALTWLVLAGIAWGLAGNTGVLAQAPADGPVVVDGQVVNPDGTITRFYKCQNRTPQDLAKILPGFLISAAEKKQTKITPYPEQNVLILTAIPAVHERLEALLLRLDGPKGQVLVEVKVVALRDDRDVQVGVESSYARSGKAVNNTTYFRGFDLTFHPADYLQALTTVGPRKGGESTDAYGKRLAGLFQGATFNFSAVDENLLRIGGFDFALRTLAGTDRLNVVSRPVVLVETGFTAIINSGEDVPVQTVRIANGQPVVDTTFRKTGVNLEITPLLVGRESVRLKVLPSVSSLVRFEDTGGAFGVSNPIIREQTAETTVNLRSGQTLEIGGLRSTRTFIDVTGVPVLADLPILGFLFRTSQRTVERETVVFFITPTILSGDPDQDIEILQSLSHTAGDAAGETGLTPDGSEPGSEGDGASNAGGSDDGTPLPDPPGRTSNAGE